MRKRPIYPYDCSLDGLKQARILRVNFLAQKKVSRPNWHESFDNFLHQPCKKIKDPLGSYINS